MNAVTGTPTAASPMSRKLLRRLGVAGFTFFLVKGIFWLIVPAALVALR